MWRNDRGGGEKKEPFFLLALSTPRVRFVEGRPFFQLFSHTCPSFPSPPPPPFFSFPGPPPPLLGSNAEKCPGVEGEEEKKKHGRRTEGGGGAPL